MAETTYKHWLAKKKKTELIDLCYKLHLELVQYKDFIIQESRREQA
jgi:hypothetical protein